MTPTETVRDERTIAVENASFRLSYLVLSFGALIIVAYRSFVYGQPMWDLLALVVLGGGVNAVYQGSRHVLTSRWAVMTAVTMAVAALVAAATVMLRGTR
jgi:hypothetical protein